MPRPFQNAALTDDGARLLTRSLAGKLHIEFTKLVVGSGEYSEQEKSVYELQKRTDLKDPKNGYVFSDISVHDEHSVKLTALITNQDPVTKKVLVDEGYYINEIGIYAKEKDNADATEVLYSISITSGDKGDYMPAYNGYSPAQITQDFFAVVGNSGDVIINSVGAALLKDGDASDTIVTFNNAEVRETISSGEKLSTLFGKIGKFFSDLKTVAFTGSYKDLADKPTIPVAVAVKGNAETAYRTGNVNLTPANIGAAPTSHASSATTYGISTTASYGHAMATSTVPKANGTATVGLETAKFARGDHVHPLQTSVTGSSGSCSGNAATATKLATARTLKTNLASTAAANFDGSANITPGVTGTLPVANGGTGKATLTANQVLVGNGTSAVSQRAIDTTAGGTLNSSSLITSGAVYSGMRYSSISVTGTGQLSVSSIFESSATEIIVVLQAKSSSQINNVYTWSLSTSSSISSNTNVHLISGYKSGTHEGLGEVVIAQRTYAYISNCIFDGTQYSSQAVLRIYYR